MSMVSAALNERAILQHANFVAKFARLGSVEQEQARKTYCQFLDATSLTGLNFPHFSSGVSPRRTIRSSRSYLFIFPLVLRGALL